MKLFGSSEHKKRTINFVKLWDTVLSASLRKDDSEYGLLRQANFYVDLVGLYSGEENVTYLYSIDGYPSELEVSFRSTLRKECKDGVRLSFISTFEKYQIQWSSPQMKAKLKTWQIIEQDEDEVNEYNIHANLASLDSQQWRKDSLTYLSEAEIRRKRRTFKYRSLMLISGKRGDDFNSTVKEVVKLCKILNIKISRVIGDIPDYLEVFSPFSMGYNNRVLDQCGCNVITDELLARFNTYSQGIVGKAGIYWGTDIYSSFPCLKLVKKTTETAENWLITAETGGGKSFFVKVLILQLLANKYYNGTIMDIEGFEYLPIANYLSQEDLVVVLNMAEGTGSYFDPVEIILTGNQDLDKDMYGLSTSFTISIFKTLLGDSSSDEWIDIVINDAVSLTYSKAGVSDDISTWGLSKGLTLFDVYTTLKSLLVDGDTDRAVSSFFTRSLYEEKMGYGKALTQNDVNRLVTSNEGYQMAIEKAIAKISRYFEANGTRAHLFKNRVSVDTIKDAKLVVCSFGMAGKSSQTTDPIQMALMQLCAANISHLRSVFSKNAGKFNFKLWEEFQRWGGFPDSEKTISTALTGGRKLGDINIIVTNAIREVLEHDRFSIFGNITSIAIGCIWDADVRSDLCSRLTIPQMLPELDRLVLENKDLSAFNDGDTLFNNPYNKAFLIGLDKTVYTLARIAVPQSLASSSLLRTGVTLNETKVVKEEEDF